MNPISGVVITNNEADNIGHCLNAMFRVCEEVIVIDSNSQDDTLKIARELGAKTVIKTWEGYSKTKNYGNNLAKNDWILSIDADEVLSEELIQEINALKLNKQNIYTLDRKNYFCGRKINYCGWSPDWKLRLFNRKKASWSGDFVHEFLEYSEELVPIKLKGALNHYSYKTKDDHLLRLKKYSKLAAKEHFNNNEKIPFWKQKLKPILKFIRTYIFKLGFLDGADGLLISRRNALFLKMKYQKLNQLWEKKS